MITIFFLIADSSTDKDIKISDKMWDDTRCKEKNDAKVQTALELVEEKSYTNVRRVSYNYVSDLDKQLGLFRDVDFEVVTPIL